MAQERLEKLKAQREAMNARIRQEEGRERTRRRRQDTRRKIIAGALVLAEEDPVIRGWLYRTLGKVLTRKDERELFGLPPLPGEKPATVSAEATRPGASPAPQEPAFRSPVVGDDQMERAAG